MSFLNRSRASKNHSELHKTPLNGAFYLHQMFFNYFVNE